MSIYVFWGIFGIGFVFGYLLYYAVRHTKEFNIEMLSIAIGAVGGAIVIALLGNNNDWIGPYGLGLLAGFVCYFIVVIVLKISKKFDNFSKIGIVSKPDPEDLNG